MRTAFLLAALIAWIGLAPSCQNQGHDHDNGDHEHTERTEHNNGDHKEDHDSDHDGDHEDHEDHGDHSDHGHDASLSLNGEAKWQMDDHTRQTFEAMSSTLSAADLTSTAGRKSTGLAMRGQIDDLIEGCTMDGEAHNQLHIFLGSYLPAVESLRDEGTEANATRVGDMLVEYREYFK